MKRVGSLLLLGSVWAFAPATSRADTFTVLVTAIPAAFTPSDLTILVGDRVVWAWIGGTHTVSADDASFDSGLHSAPFRYRRPFFSPGDVFYHCQVHGGPGGIGQSGVIHVIPGRDGDDDNDPFDCLIRR